MSETVERLDLEAMTRRELEAEVSRLRAAPEVAEPDALAALDRLASAIGTAKRNTPFNAREAHRQLDKAFDEAATARAALRSPRIEKAEPEPSGPQVTFWGTVKPITSDLAPRVGFYYRPIRDGEVHARLTVFGRIDGLGLFSEPVHPDLSQFNVPASPRIEGDER